MQTYLESNATNTIIIQKNTKWKEIRIYSLVLKNLDNNPVIVTLTSNATVINKFALPTLGHEAGFMSDTILMTARNDIIATIDITNTVGYFMVYDQL